MYHTVYKLFRLYSCLSQYYSDAEESNFGFIVKSPYKNHCRLNKLKQLLILDGWPHTIVLKITKLSVNHQIKSSLFVTLKM